MRSLLSVLQFRVVLCCLDLHKNHLLVMEDVQSENGHARVYNVIHGTLECRSIMCTDQQIVDCYCFIFLFHM